MPTCTCVHKYECVNVKVMWIIWMWNMPIFVHICVKDYKLLHIIWWDHSLSTLWIENDKLVVLLIAAYHSLSTMIWQNLMMLWLPMLGQCQDGDFSISTPFFYINQDSKCFITSIFITLASKYQKSIDIDGSDISYDTIWIYLLYSS